MATTYTLISSVTVGSGGAANIEFTSIPATYTDLVVVTSHRWSSTIDDNFFLIFNNDTSGVYSYRHLRGNGSNAASGNGSAQTSLWVGWTLGSNFTASTFSNTQHYIPNYTSSNNKSISTDSVTENNGTEAYCGFFAGLWSNSAAITSIKIQPGSNNFVQYSTAYLYGISNA